MVEAGDVTAPALVLLHGIGSSGDAFGAQFPAFADRWHLLAPDAPGYGESDDPSAAPGIDGAVYVEVPDSGHLPNQECPEVFNRIVGDWLEGLPV